MIIPFALRLAARRALTGATIAEARVMDSAIEALDDLAKKDAQPFIVVSTDEQTIELAGLDVTAGSRRCDLVIDIAVASATTLVTGEVEVSIPHTDAALELTVNLMTRQALRALFEPTSGGAWGKVFRQIVSKVAKINIRRGAGTKGVRFAAAQIVIGLDTIAEPAFGEPPAYVWADFLAAVRADNSIAPQADLIEAIMVGDLLPDWRRAISVLGINDEIAGGIGIFPLGYVDGDDSDFLPLAGVETVPGGYVGNQEAVDENVPPVPDEP